MSTRTIEIEITVGARPAIEALDGVSRRLIRMRVMKNLRRNRKARDARRLAQLRGEAS